jgi:hypothetical protein
VNRTRHGCCWEQNTHSPWIPWSNKRGRGWGHFQPSHHPSSAATAAVAQGTSQIICYKCGQPGHTAPRCPHSDQPPTSSSTSTSPSRHDTTGQPQCPCTAPPTRGNVAFAQEGGATTSGPHNALVCMACSIHMASAMSARRILDYNANPTICRPLPVPIPVVETDMTGSCLFDTTQYVSLVTPINLGQFNEFLEEHISSGLVPTAYMGNYNPLDDDIWLLIHNHPLAEQDHNFAAIVYPNTNSEEVIMEGVLPALETRFNLPIHRFPGCITRFCEFIRAYVTRRIMHCNNGTAIPITVTCRHATLCITFYPVIHETPILIRDCDTLYIVPERAIPGHWIDDDNSTSSIIEMEEAFPAIAAYYAQANAVRKKAHQQTP